MASVAAAMPQAPLVWSSTREMPAPPASPRLSAMRKGLARGSSSRVQRMREAIYWTLEEPDYLGASATSRVSSRCAATVLLAMTALSLTCLVLETMPMLAETSPDVWHIIDLITTSAFTAEYLLRLWACDVYGVSAFTWAMQPMNVCDVLATAPLYIEFIFPTYRLQWLRIFRVIRLFKVGRYSQGVQVMTLAVTNSMSALSILIFLFLMGMVFFSSAVYFTEKLTCPEFSEAAHRTLSDFKLYTEECELSGYYASASFGGCCDYQCSGLSSATFPLCKQTAHSAPVPAEEWRAYPLHEKQFTSIPVSMWWACVTMTTVGYGDMQVRSWASKLVATLAMLSGMMIIAMPFAIVGTKFAEAISLCEERLKADARMAAPSNTSASLVARRMQAPELCDRFNALRADVRSSLVLKQRILKLQMLRDNLWTSAEHAMVMLTYEGLLDIDTVALSERTIQTIVEAQPAEEEDDEALAEYSLGCLREEHVLRAAGLWLASSRVFDVVVISAIIANSAIIAMQDHYPWASEDKFWKRVNDRSDIGFLLLFTVEAVAKIVARGFVFHKNSYLQDPWNWIDLGVVLSGWVSVVAPDGSAGSLPFLRGIRVLRPLRTLSMLPGLRRLVNTIFLSLPGLKDVVFMGLFLLTMFGILGLFFFREQLHQTCRVTPRPLHFVPYLNSSCRGWCFDNSSLLLDYGGYGAATSSDIFNAFCAASEKCSNAVANGDDYYMWPSDLLQNRFCGNVKCLTAIRLEDLGDWDFGFAGEELLTKVLKPLGASSADSHKVDTFCGSSLPRGSFSPSSGGDGQHPDETLEGVTLDDWNDVIVREEFNWGITRYDSVGSSFLVVFQSVTLEGWVDVMYMLQDAYSWEISFLYFGCLIVMGSFFLLNVTLAIVWDAFSAVQRSDQRLAAKVSVANKVSAPSSEAHPSESDEKDGDAKAVQQEPSLMSRFATPMLDVRGRLRHLIPSGASLVRKTLSSQTQINTVLRAHHGRAMVRWARKLAASQYWNGFIMAIIAMNVLLLATDHHRTFGTTPVFDMFADGLNMTFNAIFVVELIIMHVALGPTAYWLNAALAFDGIIVILSVMDITSSLVMEDLAASSLSSLRAFRLLRLFKLAKQFAKMNVLLKATYATILEMREFVLLLVIIIAVFALIGQSLFAGHFFFDPDTGQHLVYPAEGADERLREAFWQRCPLDALSVDGLAKPACTPRAHFDTFLWSFITIFQILTGENWNTVMYDGMRAVGWPAAFFFVFVLIAGQFVILNLFLAILMMNFESHRHRLNEERLQGEKKRKSSLQAFIRHITPKEDEDVPSSDSKWRRGTFRAKVKSVIALRPGKGSKDVVEAFGKVVPSPEAELAPAVATAEMQMDPAAAGRDDDVDAVASLWSPNYEGTGAWAACGGGASSSSEPYRPSGTPAAAFAEREAGNPDAASELGANNADAPLASEGKVEDTRSVCSSGSDAKIVPGHAEPAESIFQCRAAHEFSALCHQLVTKWWFDRGILLCIFVSSALMCLHNPLHDPAGTVETLLDKVNMIFNVIFTLEMLIKICALGLISGPGAYLKSAWNWLDASIVIVTIVDSLATSSMEQFSFMNVFRIVRMLRPLRIISRNDNLRIVVRTIGDAAPELSNLLIFCLLVFMIFGLLGVSLFQGAFYRCVDKELNEMDIESDGPTTFCIPQNPGGARGSVGAMRFAEYVQDGACPASMATTAWEGGAELWTRSTPGTPICEVRCDDGAAEGHAFCRNTHPWGYHLMRCMDCSEEFCADKVGDIALNTECRTRCQRLDWFCVDGDQNCLEQCVASCLCEGACNPLSHDAAVCVERGGRWVNMNQNFDNVFIAVLSLFEIATTEGWVDVMLAGVDARGPMLQPRRDQTEMYVFVFVAFILVGSLFVLNLCVGVIIENYTKQRKQRGSVFETGSQEKWVAFQKVLFAKKLFFPLMCLQQLSPTRRHLVKIVSSNAFDRFIMVSVCVNTAILATNDVGIFNEAFQLVKSTSSFFFIGVFTTEAVLKLCAWRWNYFYDSWNVFDFACVATTDILMLMRHWGWVPNSWNALVNGFRIFRVARLFRLVRILKGLNKLFYAFLVSLPKLFNVACIMFLLIYLFAVLGLSLFAKVEFIDSYDDHANFRTFLGAVSLLGRSMTGEGWNEVMHSLGKDRFYYESYMGFVCEPRLQVNKDNFHTFDRDGDGVLDHPNECGHFGLSVTYFVSYTIIITFVVLNLFIAVIFDGFEESSQSYAHDIIQRSSEVWERYDPDRTMTIPLDRAFDFIDEVVEMLLVHYASESDAAPWMDKRWNESYTGTSVDKLGLALYDFRYIRLNNVSVTSDHQIRFVVAVKAITRRIICHGGLGGPRLSRGKRLQRLLELEALDQQLTTESCLLELTKLRRHEQAQAAAMNSALRVRVGTEVSLLTLVASAKIQHRYRERIQRWRQRFTRIKAVSLRQTRSSAPTLRLTSTEDFRSTLQ